MDRRHKKACNRRVALLPAYRVRTTRMPDLGKSSSYAIYTLDREREKTIALRYLKSTRDAAKVAAVHDLFESRKSDARFVAT